MTTPERNPSAGEAESTMHGKLRRAWRRERLFHYLKGLGWLTAVSVGLIFLDLTVDLVLHLPSSGRLFLLLLNLAVLGGVGYTTCARFLRRFDAVEVAHRVEARHAGLESILVSAVEFARSPVEPGISRSLTQLVQREAAARTADLDFSVIVRLSRLKRIAASGVFAIVLLTAFQVAYPGYLNVLALRMFQPSSQMAYPSQTILASCSGDQTVREGGSVWLKAEADGRIPDRGVLCIRVGEGSTWERVDLEREGAAAFNYHLGEVYRDFLYRFELGDVRSPLHRVSVIPSPRIVQAKVDLRHPAYMGKPNREASSLNLQVPEGTTLEWVLELDRAVSEATLVRAGAANAPVTIEADGKRVRVALLADRSESYHFDWVEKEHGYAYTGSQHFVQMLPDTPPQLEIVKPVDDLKGTVRRTLNIDILATDDYGLDRLCIVYRRNEEAEKRLPVGDVTKGRSIAQTVDWSLTKAIPDLREGDIVTYALEVSDRYGGEGGTPHCSRSQSRRFQVLSDAEYVKYMQDRGQAFLATVQPLYRQERKSHDTVKSLSLDKQGSAQR